MKNAVTKSSPEVVTPSTKPSPAAALAGDISLSSFDKALAFAPFTSFHVFKNAIAEPAMTIKRALSQALVYYYPIAGRAVGAAGDDGDRQLRVSCTGEGVAFVAATASCALEDVRMFDRPFAAMLKELAVEYGAEGCGEGDPLLLMQVTEFACGGFVVGVTWNHVIADGAGIAQFLQAVGDLARGLPRPCVLPVSCGDDSLPELPPLVAAIEKTMMTLENKAFAYLDVTVPSTLIGRVKAEVAGDADYSGEPCTTFEAVTAVLWRSRTRAVVPDRDAPAPLVFAANVRKYVGAKEGYYGNCVTSQVTVPTSGEVANGDLKDVVRLIRRAKEQIPLQFENAAMNGAGARMEQQEIMGVLFGYDAFYVASWRNIGFEAPDMGGGRAARVMCHVEPAAVPSCVACLPREEAAGGASVLSLCVREEHVDAFLAELSSLG
ncbi:acyl transferase 15-like [Oryza brachyantha]|uniref:acyl transferase 15-like n=1 Tax=Oryza brachyantha TaxID=4533 RepID=UPI001ADB6C3F|nr:acyl transferase 15-like [Oryza brachyantha]